MRKYEKIETIYERDINGSKKLIFGNFRDETVRYLQDNDWIWTEKVDGTNIRIYWDGHRVSFGGRTDNAQIPAPLMARLEELFSGEANEELFEQAFGEREVILFGEGYGKKIQKVGSAYLSDRVDFILFDVLIGDNYQSRTDVERTASMFNIEVVPIVGIGPLRQAVALMRTHPNSLVAHGRCEMEGLVCRPAIEMRNRCGERVIVKIKWADMKEFAI